MKTNSVIFWVLFYILLLALLTFTFYKVYKYLERKGSCKFIEFTPDSPEKRLSLKDSEMVQAGYVKCQGGGPLWKHDKLRVFNKGPGIFYIGVPTEEGAVEYTDIEVNKAVSVSVTDTAPNIYYKQGSTFTKPNLLVTSQ